MRKIFPSENAPRPLGGGEGEGRAFPREFYEICGSAAEFQSHSGRIG